MNGSPFLLSRAVKQIRKRRKRQVDAKSHLVVGSPPRDTANVDKSGLSVLGPYRDRDRWRLVFLEGEARKSVSFVSREEAEESKRQTLVRLSAQRSRTCGQVLSEFHDYCADKGLQPATLRDIQRQLGTFLPLDRTLTSIAPEEAEQLYKTLTQRLTYRGQPIAVDTHQAILRRAKLLFRWAKERGYLTRNPFEMVKPLGRCRAGKPQLRIEEARRFEATALKMAEAGDSGALGVLLMLRLGLRLSEVLHRVARDVDDGGRVLWISRGKTKNARRRLAVPPELQPLLRRLAHGQPADTLIFGSNRSGGLRARNYLWFKVRAVCERAEVPPVCPHSLRGLHATLALEGGATHAAVAAALGHSSFAITARHYADASTLDTTTARRVSATLSDPLERLLTSLSPEQRQALLLHLTDSAE